ncbi:MAG: SRPBCC family protein [Pseudoclavibacter sp.]|nr:SRPBCC family protein [Pseudoclavibacter sp.]
MLVVERIFPVRSEVLFRAFTEPERLANWFAPEGWRVQRDSVEIDPRPGGRFRHVKLREGEPERSWTIEGVYTELFEPDVIVTRQRVIGVPGIDPERSVELRLEFTRTGRDDTLLRVVQGPYTSEAAVDYSDGWESMLDTLTAQLRGPA